MSSDFADGFLIDDFTNPTSQPQLLPNKVTITSPNLSALPDVQKSTSPVSAQRRHSIPPSHVRSCITCRRRKVKCDKQDPCSHCIRGRIECVYPAPGRAPRKPRVASISNKHVSERETELLKRLRRLEGVVEELSGQVELGSVRQSPSNEPATTSSPEANVVAGQKEKPVRVKGMDEGTRGAWLAKQSRIGFGPPKTAFSIDNATQGIGSLVLEEGKSKYVASPFWASITEEVREIGEILEEHEYTSDEDAPVLPSDKITDTSHQSFIMGYSSSDVNLKALHPVPEQISTYWETFLENVHPMTMLIHAPTMGKTMKEVETNIEHLSPSTEALLFSIYFATITSMSTDEVRTTFKVERDDLIKQYRFGCEQALARASFLNTSEIVTVQAFVLFLVCVRRHDDTRFVWSMTGLALRIAQGLGLHRDGTRFNLAPFDTEMRRRLWYHVIILDLRAAEDHGTDPSIVEYSYDTEYPLNINDEDINPGDEKPPLVRTGATDMTFTLIKCEIVSLTRKLITSPFSTTNHRGLKELTLEEKEALVMETKLRLEDKYLKYCENAGPLFWVACSVARLILVKMNLLIYHPLTQPGRDHKLSPALRLKLLLSSIEIIEYARILESEGSTKQWGWIHHTYIQWHAIAFILGELAERDESPLVERAWAAIHSVFNPWGGTTVVLQKKGMLWQPLRRLMAKAKRRRDENRRNSGCLDKQIDKSSSQSPTIPLDHQAPIRPVDFGQPANTTNPVANGFRNISQAPSFFASFVPPTITNGVNIIQPSNQVNPTATQLPSYDLPQPQMQQPQQPLFDDPFLDVDMNSLENMDVNWNGWDDMVRDFQLEADVMALRDGNARGPAMTGMGNWW